MIKTDCLPCFKELAVPSRAKIISLLEKEGKLPVSAVVASVKLRQPTISYHLDRLERVGILRSKREGRQVFYKIDPQCARKHGEECKVI